MTAKRQTDTPHSETLHSGTSKKSRLPHTTSPTPTHNHQHPPPRVMLNLFQHLCTVSTMPPPIRNTTQPDSRNQRRSWIKSRMTTKRQADTPLSKLTRHAAHTGQTPSATSPHPRVMLNLFQHLCTVFGIPLQPDTRNQKRSWIKSRMTTKRQNDTPLS